MSATHGDGLDHFRVAGTYRAHTSTSIIVTRADGTKQTYSACTLETDESLWESDAPYTMDATNVEFRRMLCEHFD